jgi:hypothetical protein
MKSDLGMAHPAPVNGGDLALGPDHVTLRHLAILLIALAAAPRILQRERARQGRPGRHRAPFPAASSRYRAGQRCSPSICASVHHRPPVPLAVVAGQAQDLESSGEAIVPEPAALATRLGIPTEQLLAAC